MDYATSAITRTLIYSPKCYRYRNQLISRRVLNTLFRSNNYRKSVPSSSSWTSCPVLLTPVRSGLRCVSNSASAFCGGGGGQGGGFSGGGGDGEGGESKGNGGGIVGGGEEVTNLSSDVIVLDVGGMTCGGCASSVKRILENQPQVSSASVNLTTETAIVWPVSEAKVVANWQKELGEALAKQLTSCGFKSNFRGETAVEGDIPS